MHPRTGAGDGVSAGSGAGTRVVLYVRASCHLCEQARQVLAEVLDAAPSATTGPTWTEIDIDAGPEAPRLVDAYGELVPVVTVDGVRQGYWRLDAGRLRRALARTPT